MEKITINGEVYVRSASAHDRHVNNVLGKLGSTMRTALEKHEAYVAGGAVLSAFTNAEIHDLDIYFRSFEHMAAAFLEVTKDFETMYLSHTDKSITLTDRETKTIVQFIHFDVFPTAQSIFDCFDFTVCMAAIDIKSKTLVMHPDFLVDAASRTLHFNPGTRYPYVSLIRTRKYQERGYTIGNGHLLAIASACAQMPITSWEQAKEQLGGVYGHVLDLKVEDGEEFSTERLHQAITQIPDSLLPYTPNNDYDALAKELAEILPAAPSSTTESDS